MFLIIQNGTANPFLQYSHNTSIEKMIKTAKKAIKNNTLIEFKQNYLSVSYHNNAWWVYNDNGLSPKPYKSLKWALKQIYTW